MGKRKARFILKGYRDLKRTGRLSNVNEVNKLLSELPLYDDGAYSPILFFSAANLGELVTRQYLAQRLLGPSLSRAIVHAVGKKRALVYPLPARWRKVFTEQGFHVSDTMSSIAWACMVAKMLLFGIACMVLLPMRRLSSRKDPVYSGEYIFFDNLQENNMPEKADLVGNRDLVSWYLGQTGKTDRDIATAHGIRNYYLVKVGSHPLISMSDPFWPAGVRINALRYILWCCKATLLTLVDLARGRWWHAVLLMEAVKACLADMVAPANLAERYIFNNSGWVYRQLWTYIAEQKGSDIVMLFYSTNIEGFERSENEAHADQVFYGFKAMSWPQYMVWDKWQQEFIDRNVNFPHQCEVTGPVSFSRTSRKVLEDPAFPNKFVVIFDVQPVRDFFYRSLAVDHDFYTPNTVCKFITDNIDIFSSRGIQVVLKRKRDIGKHLHRRYRFFLEERVEDTNFRQVPPDTDAESLIASSLGVISMPFTSTALVGRHLGKPSIYYDPVGFVRKSDPGNHGVPVLHGRAELETWAASISRNLPDTSSRLGKSNVG